MQDGCLNVVRIIIWQVRSNFGSSNTFSSDTFSSQTFSSFNADGRFRIAMMNPLVTLMLLTPGPGALGNPIVEKSHRRRTEQFGGGAGGQTSRAGGG